MQTISTRSRLDDFIHISCDDGDDDNTIGASVQHVTIFFKVLVILQNGTFFDVLPYWQTSVPFCNLKQEKKMHTYNCY